MAVNYYQIQSDLSANLLANLTDVRVYIEGTQGEILNVSNMPLINIRLSEAIVETEYVGQGWTEQVFLLLDVLTFDFTSFLAASNLRSNILVALRTYLCANPMFSTAIMSSVYGPNIVFTSPDVKEGVVAMGTVTVSCQAYAE